MAARALPAPRGFWAFWWSLLAAPATSWTLLVILGLAALAGLVAPPGAHPVGSIVVALPAALLPFAVVARSAGASTAVLVPRALWAAGLGLAAIGALVAGGGEGEARVRPGESIESYQRPVAGRPTPFHFGGQLQAEIQDGQVLLRLGVRDYEVGRAALPLGGHGEAQIGPWAVALRSIEPGDDPTRLRFRARPRAGGGAPVEGAVRAGQTVALDPDTQLTAVRLSPDFGDALGAAAQLQLQWKEGQVTAWHFVDDPDLDARVGTAPWIVEPVEVLADPVVVLDVREAGPSGVAVAGWALMAVGLLGAAFGREGRV
jgi:hypothetical protein